ncbi:uncharacterized protein TNCV_1001171 [Trichonephila clavipes]|nr:uncharacterized protein TNCV_1001171 [Trichonephila clavipes]
MKLCLVHMCLKGIKRFSGGIGNVEDDGPAGRQRLAITDQNITEIRDISGFLLTSVDVMLRFSSLQKDRNGGKMTQCIRQANKLKNEEKEQMNQSSKKYSFRKCEKLIVRVHYFVRGGFVGHRSRVSSKHLSSHLPVDGVRFLGGQKGVALQLQDARVGFGSTKDFDRCWEWLRYSSRPLL